MDRIEPPPTDDIPPSPSHRRSSPSSFVQTTVSQIERKRQLLLQGVSPIKFDATDDRYIPEHFSKSSSIRTGLNPESTADIEGNLRERFSPSVSLSNPLMHQNSVRLGFSSSTSTWRSQRSINNSLAPPSLARNTSTQSAGSKSYKSNLVQQPNNQSQNSLPVLAKQPSSESRKSGPVTPRSNNQLETEDRSLANRQLSNESSSSDKVLAPGLQPPSPTSAALAQTPLLAVPRQSMITPKHLVPPALNTRQMQSILSQQKKSPANIVRTISNHSMTVRTPTGSAISRTPSQAQMMLLMEQDSQKSQSLTTISENENYDSTVASKVDLHDLSSYNSSNAGSFSSTKSTAMTPKSPSKHVTLTGEDMVIIHDDSLNRSRHPSFYENGSKSESFYKKNNRSNGSSNNNSNNNISSAPNTSANKSARRTLKRLMSGITSAAGAVSSKTSNSNNQQKGWMMVRSSSASTDLSYDNFENYHKTNFTSNAATELATTSRSQYNIYPNPVLSLSNDESFAGISISGRLQRSPQSSRSLYEKELLEMLDQAPSTNHFAPPSLGSGHTLTVSRARTVNGVPVNLTEKDGNLDNVSRLVVSIPYTHRAAWGTGISALTISSTKSFIMSSGRYDGMIRTWDCITGQELNSYSIEDRVHIHCIILAPDDSFVIAGCSDGKLYLFDLATKSKMVLVKESTVGSSSPIWSVAISPTQRFFVSGDGSRNVIVWEMAPPHVGEKIAVTAKMEDRTAGMEMGDSIDKSTVNISSIIPSRILSETEDVLDRRVNSVAVSMDGKRIFSTIANIINVWDAVTGVKLHSMNKFPFEIRFVMSPDASRLVSWGFGHSITIWNQGESVWEEQHHIEGCRAHSVILSHDGSLIFTGHNDGSVILWDGITGEQLRFSRPQTGNSGGGVIVAMSRDGTILASADSKTSFLKIWSTCTNDKFTVTDESNLKIVRRIDSWYYVGKNLAKLQQQSMIGSFGLGASDVNSSRASISEDCLYTASSHQFVASLQPHKIFAENIKVITADAKCAIVCTFKHRLMYWDLENDTLDILKGFEEYLAMKSTVIVSPDQSSILICGYFRRLNKDDEGNGSSFLTNSFHSSLFRNQDEKLYKVFYIKRNLSSSVEPGIISLTTGTSSNPTNLNITNYHEVQELYSCEQFFYYDEAFVTISCSYNASKVIFWSPENNGSFLIRSPVTQDKIFIILPQNNFVFLHCWHIAMALNGTVAVVGNASERFFIWDIEMNESIADFKPNGNMGTVVSVKLSNDNSFFVLAHKYGFSAWDTMNGLPLANVELPEKFKNVRERSLNNLSSSMFNSDSQPYSISFVSITNNNDKIRIYLNDSIIIAYRNIYSNQGFRAVNRYVKSQQQYFKWFEEDLRNAAKRRKRHNWLKEDMHLHLLQNELFVVNPENGESYDSLLHYAVKHQHAAEFVKEMLLMLPHLALVKRYGWNGRSKGHELVHENCSLLKRAARFNTKLCIKVILDALLSLLSMPKDVHSEDEDDEDSDNPMSRSNELVATSESIDSNFENLKQSKVPQIKIAKAFLGNNANANLQRLPHLGDLIDVADLCYVAKRSPDLFLDFVCRLTTVQNYYFTVTCERYCLTDPYILRGSVDRSPKEFWQPTQDELNETDDSKLGYSSKVAYPVAPFVVPIRNICSMKSMFIPTLVDAARKTGHFEVFDNEIVKMVLEYKWSNMCYKKFQRDFVLKLILFTIFSLNAFFVDHYASSDATTLQLIWGLILLSFNVMITLHFVYHEIEQCRFHFKSIRKYILDLWNVINIGANTLVVATIVCQLRYIYLIRCLHREHDNGVEYYTIVTRGLAAATFPMLGLEIMYFLGGMKSTGPLVRMIMEISKATRYFISILIITVFAFAGSFMLLFRGQQVGHGDGYYYNGFETYPKTLLTVYTFFFGGYRIQDLEQTSSPGLAIFLLAVFLCFVLIILFNMLIAIMRDRYDEVKAVYAAHATYSLTKLVLEYETITAESEKLQYQEVWYPEWVQVLKRIDKSHNFNASDSMMNKVKVIQNALDENLNLTDKIIAMIENTNHRRDALQQKVTKLDESTKKELSDINEKLDNIMQILMSQSADK